LFSVTVLIMRNRRTLGWFYSSIPRLKIISLYFT
jgi:hypothetical protein